MNIFALDGSPSLAAQYHSDKHCVKMILETAQLLCTAHHILSPSSTINIPYKKTHSNHPSAVWARENTANYKWLCSLGKELCAEYSFRYGKIHKTQAVIEWAEENLPSLKVGELTPFSLAMPEIYKTADPVASYRKYYIAEKSYFKQSGGIVPARWSKRSMPGWFKEGLCGSV